MSKPSFVFQFSATANGRTVIQAGHKKDSSGVKILKTKMYKCVRKGNKMTITRI